LSFCLDDRIAKFEAFWHTIFPGSKRLMNLTLDRMRELTGMKKEDLVTISLFRSEEAVAEARYNERGMKCPC
jgi:hypothetical protein